MENVLNKDISDLISCTGYFKPFENSSVLVTGATGLIGSILIKSLLSYARNNRKKILVYASCRSKEKFNTVFKDYFSENLIPIFSDITSLNISKIQVDYIVHGASITDSKIFVEKPIETIDVALNGTKNLLKQCIGKSIKGFVYLSSLEVYGTFPNCNDVKNVSEKDFGYIDILKVRSSYSEGKRMVECICSSYANEYEIPVKIVRLCQTFGAGVNYSDNRVFAQFARSVIERKNIVLKTKGETVRNYCYTTDAVSGILTVLSKGNIGEAYNIANMQTTISIADMAQLFCNLFPESSSKVTFDIADDATKLGYNPIVKIQLDSSKAEKLGWKAYIPLNKMCRQLVLGMKESL